MSKADDLRLLSDRADAAADQLYVVCINAAQAEATKGFYDVSVEIRNTAKVCRVIERLENQYNNFSVTRTYKGGHTILHLSWRPE